MKKSSWLLLVLSVIAFTQVFAVPAYKGSVKVSQPDGGIVTLQLHGDEYLHFTTTDDGYSVVKNSHGAYVYAQLDAEGQLVPTAVVAHDAAQRMEAEVAYLQGVKKHLVPTMTEQSRQMKQTNQALAAKARQAAMNKAPQYDYNNFRGLVILIEYNDKSFSRSDYKTIIDNMINKENYTGFFSNGRKQNYTGSVRDYFSDNSGGKFKPEFDVFGPYKVNYSQYDAEGSNNAVAILNAAVTAADSEINFQNYDRDNDGTVDMIYFLLAGNGSNYGGNDQRLWWPHRSILYNRGYVVKDGVYLWDYASSVELAGYTAYPNTVIIDGIGTICHEFGHVLGLPDFYDTDYEQSGGESIHPGEWSIMAGGSYLNNGRTPAGYSLFERYAIGFTTPELINAEGDYSLEAIGTSNTGYRINTKNDKEFFFVENRQQDKWNAYLPGHGMLVFRVDSTNARAWNYNEVNNNPDHNYYELLRAGGYQKRESASDPFPGTKRVRTLNASTSPANLMSWSGDPADWGLDNIEENSGLITFSVVDVNVLKTVTLPATATVDMNFSIQLEAVCTPSYALKTLEWESSDPSIATVTQNGLVRGIAEGTATIKVTANSSLEATCEVTVKKPSSIENIAAFKALEEGSKKVLKLSDAKVLLVHENDIYVRDISDYIVLSNCNITAKRNDVLNGMVVGTLTVSNGVYKLVGDSEIVPDVQAVAGDEAVARPVTVAELSETDYSDLVVLSGVKLQKSSYQGLSGIYVVDDDKYVRLFNTFGLTKDQLTMPTNYNKLYDITGIPVPRVQGSNVIMELGIVKSPTVAEPNGISSATIAGQQSAPVYFTLAGRRIETVTQPGLYIVKQDGKTRKVMVK